MKSEVRLSAGMRRAKEVGFPHSSVGKETSCNAGDPSSIPGLGRSVGRRKKLPTPGFWPGEFHGLYSSWGGKESDRTERLSFWAFLVAQVVKTPPVIWETWVRSLGWEDPLEKGKATYSSILAQRIP